MQLNAVLTRSPVYLLIYILLITRSAWGQQQFESSRNLAKAIVTPSPAAAGIGTFGNTPVSRYTGTPDIGVPLYEVNYKDLSIDLSLKYHQAIGTKPDAFPGSTGNGWVLNSGGVITRISRGATAINMPAGYPLPVNFNPTAAADWSSQAKMDDHLSKQTVFINPEGRYDEYAYNFAGYSGKFYIDHTDAFRIRTEQGEDILVEKVVKSDTNFILPQEVQMSGVNCIVFPYTDTLSQRYIVYKFTLTDSKGIKYTFGGNNESIEITRPGMEYGVADLKNENPIPTSWYLTSVESPHGYKIDLKYTRGKFYITNEISVFGRNISQNQWRDPAIDVPHPPYIKSTMYHPCYLDEIVTPISKVKFNWSIANQQLGYNFTVDCMNNNISGAVHFYFYPNVKNASLSGRFPNKLDNFIVSDVLGIRRKKIDFTYTNSTATRLKLLSVKLRGDSDTPLNVPTYTFEYNPTALPAYLALKTDDYGFFNNNDTYTSSTDPQYYYNLFTNAASRQNYLTSRAPNATYAVAEVLQKVTYPTGGYTEYEFELNQYGRAASFGRQQW